jgi:hypothetical protein
MVQKGQKRMGCRLWTCDDDDGSSYVITIKQACWLRYDECPRPDSSYEQSATSQYTSGQASGNDVNRIIAFEVAPVDIEHPM